MSDHPTAYLVLASQRSGSTLLVESLRATGVAGEPQEFFQYLPTREAGETDPWLRGRPRGSPVGISPTWCSPIRGEVIPWRCSVPARHGWNA